MSGGRPGGGVRVGPATRLGGRVVGAPVATGWDDLPPQPGTRALGYEHTQSTPARVWLISHELTFTPTVTVTGPLGQTLHPQRTAHRPGATVLTFPRPVPGKAVLS